MLFLLPHTVFWDFTLCPSPQTGDQTFLLSSHFSFTQHCITTTYCTRKTIAGNSGFMIYFDKIALTLVSQWRSLADVSHLSVFSVSCVMNVMFLRQIYIHTEGQSRPCLGDGSGWSSCLPTLVAELPGRKRKQGQSSSQQAIDKLLP